jgi:lipoate-protein ligase A
MTAPASDAVLPISAWPVVQVIVAPPHTVIESAALGEAQVRLVREPILSLIPRFHPPTLSIGYFQSAAEVPPGRAFVRRLTGGGLVDAADGFSVCAIVPPRHPRFALSPDDLLISFSEAVATALAEIGRPVRLAWDAGAFQPGESPAACFDSCFRYDLMEGGRKVAAGSFYRCATGLMQEMGIHLGEVDPDRLGDALVRCLVPLYGGEPRPAELAPAVRRLAEVLFAERYNTPDWNNAR